MKKSFRVSKEESTKRIDAFLAAHVEDSRKQLKRWFEENRVHLNGRKAKKTFTLKENDVVEVEVEDAGAHLEAQAIPESIEIIFEDDDCIVINKPSQVASVALAESRVPSVAAWLLKKYPQVGEASDKPLDAGLVHRLDFETSGALLAAKNSHSFKELRATFSKQSIEKKYCAVVQGPIAREGTIELALEQRGDHVVVANSHATKTQEAITRFNVVEKFKHGISRVDIWLVTGVMHQIRAHFSAVGAPLLNDVKYGAPQIDAVPHFLLHAASLEWKHPTSGKNIRVSAELPKAFSDFLSGLPEK